MGGARLESQQDMASMAMALRSFDRMVSLKMRPLREVIRGPAMHASYLRVLRELGNSPSGTYPSALAGRLKMHPGLISRILAWFRALGYLEETRDSTDGRKKRVKLSTRGRSDYRDAQREVTDTAEYMLMLLRPAERERLFAAMATIEAVLRYSTWENIP